MYHVSASGRVPRVSEAARGALQSFEGVTRLIGNHHHTTPCTMHNGDMDTETLLAMLSSVLHPQEFEEAVLLDALVSSQGDIEDAARSLSVEPPNKRRKVSEKISIDGWLKQQDASKPAAPKEVSHQPSGSTTAIKPTGKGGPQASSSSSHTASPKKPNSNVKKVSNSEFLELLRPPNSFDGTTSKPQVPRLPPLTLSTPEMVAEHTPCTLHHSVLPPELACR